MACYDFAVAAAVAGDSDSVGSCCHHRSCDCFVDFRLLDGFVAGLDCDFCSFRHGAFLLERLPSRDRSPHQECGGI